MMTEDVVATGQPIFYNKNVDQLNFSNKAVGKCKPANGINKQKERRQKRKPRANDQDYV